MEKKDVLKKKSSTSKAVKKVAEKITILDETLAEVLTYLENDGEEFNIPKAILELSSSVKESSSQISEAIRELAASNNIISEGITNGLALVSNNFQSSLDTVSNQLTELIEDLRSEESDDEDEDDDEEPIEESK